MCAAVAGQRGRRVVLLDHAAEAGTQDPDLGRRAVQLHQHADCAGAVLLRQPALRPLGPGALHGGGFLRPGSPARHRQPRKDAGPMVLRRVGAVDRGHAAGRVRGGGGGGCGWAAGSRGWASPTGSTWRRMAATFTAEALVLATGGLSIPKLGATAFAYDAAQRFGLKANRTAPCPGAPGCQRGGCRTLMRPLSGVALPVEARCNGVAFRDGMLFTHRGLSGPAVLQVSSAWRDGQAVTIDLLPGADVRCPVALGQGHPATRADAAHHPGRPAAATPGGRAGAPLARRGDGQPARPHPGRRRGSPVPLGGRTGGHGGLRQGGSDAGRRGHRRAVVPHDGGESRCRGCSWWARRWTSRAGSADTISSGRGRAAGAPAWRRRALTG